MQLASWVQQLTFCTLSVCLSASLEIANCAFIGLGMPSFRASTSEMVVASEANARLYVENCNEDTSTRDYLRVVSQ